MITNFWFFITVFLKIFKIFHLTSENPRNLSLIPIKFNFNLSHLFFISNMWDCIYLLDNRTFFSLSLPLSPFNRHASMFSHVGVNCTCNINYIWGAPHTHCSFALFARMTWSFFSLSPSGMKLFDFFAGKHFFAYVVLVYVVNKSQLNEHETISISFSSFSAL